MRIALVAPLIESVPPRLYGGTERVVSYLAEELTQLGHDVALFASGDSITSARLVPSAPAALRLAGRAHEPAPYYMLMLERLRAQAEKFDMIHFHIDFLHFQLFRDIAPRTVTTLHGRQDLAGLDRFYEEFQEYPLVSVSNAQRQPLAGANFVATIYHGLPVELHSPNFSPRGGYFAFLGRISPEKGVTRAIEIARAMGMPLKIAAKVERMDETYFKERVGPLLKEPGVEFIGEINERQKTQFLGDSIGLLFPIDWPEPFGLTMIEAMACGVPVLAFRNGSVVEVLDEGVTGVVVDDVQSAIKAVPRLLSLDRRAVRRHFERRFSSRSMAKNYLDLYRRLVTKTPGVQRQRSDAAAVGLSEMSPGS